MARDSARKSSEELVDAVDLADELDFEGEDGVANPHVFWETPVWARKKILSSSRLFLFLGGFCYLSLVYRNKFGLLHSEASIC